MAAKRFDLTLVLDRGPNESHYKLLKVYNPTVVLEVVDGCPVCDAVVDFFEEEGATLTIRPQNKRTAPPPKKKSTALSAEYPAAWYFWDREYHEIPLPPTQDGAAPATLRRRLRSQFLSKGSKPREHQKDLHRAFQERDFDQRNTPAFTIMWEMGAGKTFGATSTLINHRSNTNMIVCDNTNIEYWVDHVRHTPFVNQEEIAAGAAKPPPPADTDDGVDLDAGVECGDMVSRFVKSDTDVVLWFEVVGYTAFCNAFDHPRALRPYTCVVLDEAHYFRNNTSRMQVAIEALHSAKNIMLLTGTPLVNDVTDLVGMLELIDMDRTRPWQREYDASKTLPKPAEVTAFLKGHVSWFDPRTHRPNMHKKFYPKLVDTVVKVPMTWVQTLEYLMARRSVFQIGGYAVQQGKSNRYNCLTRAVCNAPSEGESPKLREVSRRIAGKLAVGPQVAHSSLVQTGVKPLQDLCLTDGILEPKRTAMITGTTPNADRETRRNAYNKKGKLDVLFISDASQFGIDLKATAAIHLTEPHPNLATENQTTGRAVRMGSHNKCPYKTVERFKYLSTFPPAPPTAAELEACRDYLRRHRVFGPHTAEAVASIDLKAELMAKVHDEEANETINEIQERDNHRKAAAIEPYNTAMRKASVAMSTQKGARLFDEDRIAEDPATVRAEKKKAAEAAKAAKAAKQAERKKQAALKAGAKKSAAGGPKKAPKAARKAADGAAESASKRRRTAVPLHMRA